MKNNLFNPSNPKQDNAYNSTTSFADTAREVESQDREHAQDVIAAMIAQTKKEIISNE